MSPAAIDPTSLGAAQANQLAASTADAADLNADEITKYNGACRDAALTISSGHPENAIWPAVPMAWVVAAPDPQGFAYPVQSTTPVCAAIAPPASATQVPIPAPGTPVIKQYFMGSWYVADPTNTFGADSTANGETPYTVPKGMGGPADDGTTHLFQFVPGPVNNPKAVLHSGWFLMVG